MRILAVTPYYEPEGGGLERYAHAILSRLAARGHDVHAVAASRSGAQRGHKDGVFVERQPASFHVGNAPVDMGLARRVRWLLQTWRPDVVLGHAPVPFPAEVACREARRAKIPFVLTYHAGRLRGSSLPLDIAATVARATIERQMFAASTGLIAVSPFVRDNALYAHRQRVSIVPPGVDVGRFKPSGLPAQDEILFVGPLAKAYRWKGVDVLLQAFEKVQAVHPSARLRLVGSGDRAPHFQALARRSGGAVRVEGRLPEHRLAAAYQNAATVVLPSITDAEAFGMVLAEANGCGRPVVGSRIGGIPDFIEDGVNGLLATAGDADDLAGKLLAILQDTVSAGVMGRAGRERILAQHDWTALAARTEAVLQDAMRC